MGAVPGPPRLERGLVTLLTPGRGSCSERGGGGATPASSASRSMLSSSVKLSSSSSSAKQAEDCIRKVHSATRLLCYAHNSTLAHKDLMFVQGMHSDEAAVLCYSASPQARLISD